MGRTTLRSFVLVSAVLLLVGCGSGTTAWPEQPSWEEVRQSMLEVAREEGASPEQIEVISAETLEFVDYKAAVDRTVSCLRGHGISVVGDDVTYTRGYPEISYSYAVQAGGLTEAETDALSQECITSNSLFVESLYRDSPPVQRVLDESFEEYRDSVVECLRAGGQQVMGDETRWQLEYASGRHFMEGGVDCSAEVLF